MTCLHITHAHTYMYMDVPGSLLCNCTQYTVCTYMYTYRIIYPGDISMTHLHIAHAHTYMDVPDSLLCTLYSVHIHKASQPRAYGRQEVQGVIYTVSMYT